MHADKRLLAAVLTGLGRRYGRDVFVLNIGAMDGESFDDTRPHVDRFRWRGLFVEPIPEMFDRLVASFLGHTGIRFERAAIADEDGTVEMVRIPPAAVERGELGPALLGMSSRLPPRNALTSARARAVFARHGESIRVPATTLPSLLARHGVERVDVLHVHVEGYEWEVLRQFDFDRFRPVVVRLETSHLPAAERAEAREHLAARGYALFDLDTELAAIVPEAVALDSTLVTAVYERSPDDVLGGRGAPLARYLPSLASIARMSAPLVVYTQPRLAARVSEFLRAEGADAVVVPRPLASVPRFWEVQELRIRERVHTMPHRDRCHVLGFAKFPWLAEQARENPFGTSRFYWVDAGLVRPDVFPARRDLFSPALPFGLRQLYRFVVFALAPLAGPYLHTVEVEEMQRIAGARAEPIATHVVGALFGGGRDDVLRLAKDHDAVLMDLLTRGLLGTEENVLTILYARAPADFTPQVFTTWHHEESGTPFYRLIERLGSGVSSTTSPSPH
jgi:FkbM family methyltransferase